MVKPFEMLELLVRIDKVLKRFHPDEAEVYIKDVVIDPGKRTVTKKGREIILKPMEFDGETRTVDAHISRIRKKLGFGDVIKTIPRIGYRLEVDE